MARGDSSAAQIQGVVQMRPLIVGPDGKEMVLIPAGPFIYGSEEYGPETPQQTVILENYYIDKYPVTNVEYKRFVNETGHRAALGRIA